MQLEPSQVRTYTAYNITIILLVLGSCWVLDGKDEGLLIRISGLIDACLFFLGGGGTKDAEDTGPQWKSAQCRYRQKEDLRDFFEIKGKAKEPGTAPFVVTRRPSLGHFRWPSAPCKKRRNLRTGIRVEAGGRVHVVCVGGTFSSGLISIMVFHINSLTYGSDGEHSLIHNTRPRVMEEGVAAFFVIPTSASVSEMQEPVRTQSSGSSLGTGTLPSVTCLTLLLL